MDNQEILEQIKALVTKYADNKYKKTDFIPNQTVVPPSGKVIDADELTMMVEASLDGWLTTGRFNEQFETKLKKFLGVR